MAKRGYSTGSALGNGQASTNNTHVRTVAMIEQDILDAEALLNRFDDDGDTEVSRVQRGRAHVGSQRLSHDDSEDSQASRRPVSISDSRRRQILAQLANERAERRGFASERELRVSESAQREAEGLQEIMQRPIESSGSVADPASGRQALATRGAASVEQALQEAASAAVASALDKAFASLSRTGPPAQPGPSVSVPSGPSHEKVVTSADQAAGEGEAGGAARQSPAAPEEGDEDGESRHGSTPYAHGIVATNSKAEREALIARLLAERRAKVRAEGGRGTSPEERGRGRVVADNVDPRHVRVPTLPSVPPLVAALQAEARSAAVNAVHAAEAAARASLEQKAVERRIAEQRRVLEAVSHGDEAAYAAVQAAAALDTASSAPAPRLNQRSPHPSSTSAKLTNGHMAHTAVQGTAPSPTLPKTSAAVSKIGPGGGGRGRRKPFRRPTKAEISAERESKLYGECTFRPSVHMHGGGKGEDQARGTSGAVIGTSPGPNLVPEPTLSIGRLSTLARTKAETWAALERTRAEEEEARMRLQCTFQPNASYDEGLGHVVDRRGVVYAGAMDGGRSKSPALAHPKSEEEGPGSKGQAQTARSSSTSMPVVEAQADAARAAALAAVPGPLPLRSHSQAQTQEREPAILPPALQSPLQWDKSRAKAYVDETRAPATAGTYAGTHAGTVRAGLGHPVLMKATPTPIPPPPPMRSMPVQAPTPVAARLYAEADARALARARAKAALEQAQMASYSFRPSINPVSLALVHKQEEDMVEGQGEGGHKPLHERSAALARAHEQHMHRLRVEAAMANPDTTFKPRINALSDKIAAAKALQLGRQVGSEGEGARQKGQGKAVSASVAATQRILAEAAAVSARKLAAREEAERARAEAYSYAPRCLPASERILEAKMRSLGLDEDAAAALAGVAVRDGTPTGDAFLARQAVMNEVYKKKKRSLEAGLRAADGCTFRPDIGNAEEILALTRPEMVTESDSDRVLRLAQKDAADVAHTRAALSAQYYDQFTYKPAINAISRARGRSRTIEERSRNEAGARQRLRARAIAEAAFHAAHPFQPTLVAKEPVGRRGGEDEGNDEEDVQSGGEGVSGGAVAAPLRLAVLTDPEHVSARVTAHERAKEAKREAARKLAEYEAMQGCTFAPDTEASKRSHAKLTESIAADGGVVVVRGLGRHLELRELSRRLDDVKRERETAAFAVKGLSGPGYDDVGPGERKPATVPEPFHLSTAETAPVIGARHERGRDREGGPVASHVHAHPGRARVMLERLMDGPSGLEGEMVTGPSQAPLAVPRQVLDYSIPGIDITVMPGTTGARGRK